MSASLCERKSASLRQRGGQNLVLVHGKGMREVDREGKVCVCACECETVRECERKRERGRGRERGSVCVRERGSVCERESVRVS
jgi:hypothetical protein